VVNKRIILSDLTPCGNAFEVKFHLQTPAGHNLFTGHGAGYVNVNAVRFTKSLLVTPERIIEDWPATDFASLDAGHFAQLIALKPDLVLLGTGPTLRFPHPALSSCLHAAHIGLEVMDNAAVCRTYNILLAEGRNVVAAVLLG
jgi:uncharacterized protein